MPLPSIPRITKTLDFGGYCPEMAGQTMPVWVNPPSSLALELSETRSAISGVLVGMVRADTEQKAALALELEEYGKKLVAWAAKIWGMPEEEVKAFVESNKDTDPLLFSWLIGRSDALIHEHRHDVKKK